jgi:hypothetical protein
MLSWPLFSGLGFSSIFNLIYAAELRGGQCPLVFGGYLSRQQRDRICPLADIWSVLGKDIGDLKLIIYEIS